jgi:hypothetical protein
MQSFRNPNAGMYHSRSCLLLRTHLRIQLSRLPVLVLLLLVLQILRARLPRHVFWRPNRHFPFCDTTDKLGIAFVPNERPAFLIPDITIYLAPRDLAFDQGLGVLEVAVDGLDCVFDATSLYSVNVMFRKEKCKTNLTDLLAQHFRLDDHPLAVRRLPQSPREHRHVELLHADSHA